MKKSLLYKLAIAASVSFVASSCTPATPPATTPSATASASAKPSASASPSTSPAASSSPSASAKPASPAASASPSTSTSPATSPAASASSAAPATEKVPDTVRVSVVNNSGKVLNAIYMSPPTNINWGKNELEAPIPDREKADFEWNRSDYKGEEAGCLFEVRAEYADGKSTDLEEINLCKTPTINLK